MVTMKSTKVYPASKTALEEIKEQLEMKSEADVIAYLIAHYNDSWEKIVMPKDRQYKQVVAEQRRGYQIQMEIKGSRASR